MNSEFDLYGVFLPGLFFWMAAAFAVHVVIRKILSVAGVYRHVWHPPLFDFALYFVILGFSVLIGTSLWT